MNDLAPFDLGEALLKWNRENNLGAADYDRMTERQIAAMCQEPKQVDQETEIRAALIADNMEGLRFWGEDVGALVAVREAFPGNSRIRDLAGHLIRLEEREMEELTEGIERWRG